MMSRNPKAADVSSSIPSRSTLPGNCCRTMVRHLTSSQTCMIATVPML